MEVRIGRRVLHLVEGDITKQSVDAIVNAANSGLRGGGGVDGAIHRAGGPEIMAECRTIGGCPTGSAVATTAGRLNARFVIHAVGPIWTGGDRNEPDLLASAYHTSLQVADERGVKSIAFPSLSTGAYGYPMEPAARIALSTVIGYLKGPTGVEQITVVLFGRIAFDAYAAALQELTESDADIRPV